MAASRLVQGRAASRLLAVLSGVLLLLAVGGVALASDVTGALFNGKVIVTNNGTATGNVSVPFTLNTQALIDGGYIVDNATNSAIRTQLGSDIAYMPAQGSTGEWVIFVPSIDEDAQLNYGLYTGGGDMNSKIRYFPTTAGMTSSDNASLELATEFAVEQSGWWNTDNGTANKSAVYKEDAFHLFVSETVSGNITLEISPGTGWRSPTSANGTGWVSIQNTHDDNAATYSRHTTSGNSWTDFVYCSIYAINCDKIRYYWNDPDTSYITIDFDAYYSGSWNDIYQGAPGAQEAWVERSLPSEQRVLTVRLRFYNDNAAQKVVDLHEVDFNKSSIFTTVSAAGVASGEHTVQVSQNATHLSLYIDDVLASASTTDLVPDNENGWTFLENGVMPYMEHHKITVAGTLVQHIEWENDTVFSDLSGHGQDATPTFRTTTTDPDVSAEMDSFEAIAATTLTDYEVEDAVEMATVAPTQPTNLYTETVTPTLPFVSFINRILTGATIPTSLFWFSLAFGTAIVIGFLAAKVGNNGSLLVQAIVSGFVIGFWVAVGVVPGWVLIPFAIEATVVIMMHKSPAPF